MTRWFLLCTALISLPIVTDAIIDYQFRHQHPDRNIGYSKHDRDGMDRLVEASRTKVVYIWRDKKSAAIASVWNLTPDSLDSAVDIYGRR